MDPQAQTPVPEQNYFIGETQVSRAEYIRHLFKVEDKSRGEIAKQLDVPYSTVYSATTNLENTHHQAGSSNIIARKFVSLDDGTQMARAEYIRARIKEGATRGELVKELGITYSAVWAASKDMEEVSSGNAGGAIMIPHPETGEMVKRVDVIREMWTAGKTRREIANALVCDYAIVWAATHTPKPKEEEVAGQPAGDPTPTPVPEPVPEPVSENQDAAFEGLEDLPEDTELDSNFPD